MLTELLVVSALLADLPGLRLLATISVCNSCYVTLLCSQGMCKPSWLLCRYVVYLESLAWSTNGRHKFSCGSVVISNKMGYYEFFTRALKPGVHYVEVDPDNLCDDIIEKVTQFLLLLHMYVGVD